MSPEVPLICKATVPVINCVMGAEVDPSVVESPKYCAVIVCTPTGNDAARKDAIPALTLVGAPSVCPLSISCTKPDGVALPFGVTVMEKVTGVPDAARRLEDEIVVVVLT